MRRVGVMGGTFDPIHHGHLVAASETAHRFDLDEVVFVPAGAPWQKAGQHVSPAEDRYLMTVIATAADPRFRVSRVDLDREGRLGRHARLDEKQDHKEDLLHKGAHGDQRRRLVSSARRPADANRGDTHVRGKLPGGVEADVGARGQAKVLKAFFGDLLLDALLGAPRRGLRLGLGDRVEHLGRELVVRRRVVDCWLSCGWRGKRDNVGAAHVIGCSNVSGAIASGYLDDPELTAARFYEDADGRSWWRSGDLVSVDHTGMYRHEGRMDDVVKVGGKLASPSEVTAVLQGIEGVVAAITVPVVTDGNTRLVSHVEIEPGTEVRLEAVRATLRARLQPHAVPSAVMRHRRMPVNVRGKVDRQALADGPFEPW